VADAAAVLSAGLDGAALVLPVAGQRLWLSIEPCPADDRRAKRRSRGLAQCRGDRQPERQNHGKSGGPRGYDAGKKIKGRKRHILTDTDGNLVHAVIHTADIQDRDGAPLVLAEIIKRFPWLRHVFADGGYAGDKLGDALRRIGKWTIESSSDPIPQKASWCSHAAGSSNAHWLGSIETAALPRTSSKPSHRPPHGCSSPQSSSSPAASQDHEIT
jgi:transposase